MEQLPQQLTIGRLAKMVDVGVETVRYYERRGLLEQPARGTGYRTYTDADVERLRFVRRAKDLGFTLTEISQLIERKQADADPSDIASAARTKLARLDAEIYLLMEQRCQLRQLLQLCDHGDGTNCVALRLDQVKEATP